MANRKSPAEVEDEAGEGAKKLGLADFHPAHKILLLQNPRFPPGPAPQCPSRRPHPHGHAPDDARRLVRGDSRGRGHYPACPAARWRSEGSGQRQKLKTQGPQGLEEITVPAWKEEEVATCPSSTPERPENLAPWGHQPGSLLGRVGVVLACGLPSRGERPRRVWRLGKKGRPEVAGRLTARGALVVCTEDRVHWPLSVLHLLDFSDSWGQRHQSCWPEEVAGPWDAESRRLTPGQRNRECCRRTDGMFAQVEQLSPPRMTSAAPAKKPYRKAPPEHRELRLESPGSRPEQEEPLTDAERMKLLQQENEELRRRLASATRRTEALERELEIGQDCLELELGQSREELDKFKDKFRRLQNSYTASQRTNQELEDKLHTLIKKAEMDRKTLDWEIVELTNKLLDARNTINKLEELNERYRLDCNLAVQLLKCNKSHFRNHKFADLPCELQDMVRKHLHSGQEAASPGPASSLAPGAVVPTSVIARVLEKPESLLLNSAQSGSAGHPLAEDVFVHVDMSGGDPGDSASPPAPSSPSPQPNGECHSLGTAGGSPEEELPLPAFEKLSPYPTPSPPHPLYPGRRVIEFSEDKVRIPRNSPLPNCTYATRQAISLSLVEEGSERARPSPVPSSPASAQASPQHQPRPALPALSAPASSASSEEDLLASWQRAFVDRAPPPAAVAQRTAFGRDALPELQRHFALGPTGGDEVQAPSSPPGESGLLLLPEADPGFPREEDEEELNLPVSPEEERQSLLPSDAGTEEGPSAPCPEGRVWALPSPSRPQRSPKRMGVHHLHRKDSLTQAQEQGTLLH